MRCNPGAELVLVGRYDEAGVGPPLFPAWDIVRIAAWVIDKAGRPVRSPDPVHLAVAHKVRVLDQVPLGAGNECCDGERIYYRWDRSRRIRGTRVFHGLAHCAFGLAKWRGHTEADAVILTAELALPTEVARECRTLADAMRIQPHADPWLLRAQLRRARLLLAA